MGNLFLTKGIRFLPAKKIQHQRVHATGTGGGPTPQRLILSPLEELLRAKLLPVVVEGLPGDRDIGIYPSQFPPVAPEGHVSPETEQVSSPGSASSTHLEEHDEEDFDDDDDDDDDDDAAAAAIDTQIQASDHEEVPIETVLPPKRPANTTYDAIVASEGKIVEAENRRHSDLMTVLERMIALQEETVSQLAHLHRVFIEVPKQLQKINTSFEALVVQQTQANYWRMTNVPQFNTSQPGSVHAGQFSPHSSDIHSPGPNVTGQVADIAVQVPDDILPLPSVQIQQQTPTKEATKTKQDTHETDQPSLVQCLLTCSHVSVGTSPVREQSLPKSPHQHTQFKKKSIFCANNSKGPFISTFEKLVERDLKILAEGFTIGNPRMDNLTGAERHELLKLQKDKSLVIKKADKGGAIVIQSSEDYNMESLRQLGDTLSYKKLKIDPTQMFLKELRTLLEFGERGIPKCQLLRLKRLCSTEENFDIQAQKLITKFRERGYKDRDLTETLTLVKSMKREDLLSMNISKKEQWDNDEDVAVHISQYTIRKESSVFNESGLGRGFRLQSQ
ncbi:uncharacterized protein LOC142490629 [Ascaphus truei]|uniref:uncharacterized protein LOC142490629 n=1 Tax=Ascaphus truei TaxID=8439 RepID=UPI003F597A4E